MGKSKLWVIALALIVPLAGTIFSAYMLNRSDLAGSFLRELFPSEPYVNICPGQLRAFEFADGWRVATKEGRWMIERPKSGLLNPAAMEKWLRRYCTLPSSREEPTPAPAPKNVTLRFEFIDGQSLEIGEVDHSHHIYTIQNQPVISEKLTAALAELRQLLQSPQYP